MYEELDESYVFELDNLPKILETSMDVDAQVRLLGPYPNYTGSSYVSRIRANTTLGLLRGLETFTQLVYTLPPPPSSASSSPSPGSAQESEKLRYLHNPPLFLFDAPMFPHRLVHELHFRRL